MDADRRPPCIVVGTETQIGLGIVRELGRQGVPVIGVAHERNAIGLRSRYVAERVYAPEPRSPALIETIKSIGSRLGPCYLITISDANAQFFQAHRDELGPVVPLLPSRGSLALALDKKRTLALAESVGLTVPRTAEPTSLEHARALALDFPFPAILKWGNPEVAGTLLRSRGLPLVKVEYVGSADEFVAACARYEAVRAYPLLQQYCPGVGFGQFFFMHGAKVLRRFQHVRIAEWPPEGGFSSVCDSVPIALHAELQERSVALLRAMEWEGVAMVEFRLDPASGRAMLMEVNGRFWGSFPLAVHCGAGFATLTYSVQGLGRVPALPPLREHLRCRMVATEVKRLCRILLFPGRIADKRFKIRRSAEVGRFFLDFVRPRVRYYVWSRDDPMPFFVDVANFLFKLLSRLKSAVRRGARSDVRPA